MENGFFPAYHMRKDSWITVALDGSVADDKIKMLLDVSYQATAPKVRKKRGWQRLKGKTAAAESKRKGDTGSSVGSDTRES